MFVNLIRPLDPTKRLGDCGEWDSPYSWPVRREFSRILHRPRPHLGIVYTERFLNSRPLTYFDDETKIIRAKAGALLRQVHNPLPKPSKVLRPYESLDEYTAHHLIPYGVPQHVYHQSYFSEPAHLTIGRGHLACIQFAGGKGYPRRKHLYSDENRNIRDEIKFRSYYNRPRNEDPSSLPTGFASRLLHLPLKDNKPFKLYKHTRTLPLLDSSKSEKKKPDSTEEVKERPSYRKYQKTSTEPIDDTLKTDSRTKVQTPKEEIIEKPKEANIINTPRNDDVSDIKVNEKPKEETSADNVEENDAKKSKKILKISNQSLNKSKPLVSNDKEVIVEKHAGEKERKKSEDAPVSVPQIPVIEDKPVDKPADISEQKNETPQDAPRVIDDKPIDKPSDKPEQKSDPPQDAPRVIEDKPIDKPTDQPEQRNDPPQDAPRLIEDKPSDEPEQKNDPPQNVPRVVEDKPSDKPEQKNDSSQYAPSSTVNKVITEDLVAGDNHEETITSPKEPCLDDVKPEENLNKVEEVAIQGVHAQEAHKECNIADTAEFKPTEEIVSIASEEKSTEQERSEALPEIEEKSTSQEIINPPEPIDTISETAPKEESSETNIKTDIVEEKMVESQENLSQTENPKTEDIIQDHQAESVEETSEEIISNEQSVKMETITQVEQSNITVELNDNKPSNLDDSAVTITEIHEESTDTITQVPDGVTESLEGCEISETVSQETVTQEESSTVVLNSEAQVMNDN